MTGLKGKTLFVSGGSRGIGLAIALRAARDGANVAIAAKTADPHPKLKGTIYTAADEIRAAGGKAEKIGVDLAQPEGPHELARHVRAIVGGRLDVLVANAGIAKAATIEDTTLADFDALFAVNVRAPFFLVQQLLPALHEGSSVVLLSSLAAHASVGTLSAYSATKGAIDTLVKHFAAALGPRGIRVNAVAPGVVDTDMSSFARTPDGKAFTLGMQALQRLAQADDIAGAVAFLASNESRWITGDTLRVDGGSKL